MAPGLAMDVSATVRWALKGVRLGRGGSEAAIASAMVAPEMAVGAAAPGRVGWAASGNEMRSGRFTSSMV